jgi:hypothetical protein
VDTSEMQKTHYSRWKKRTRDSGMQDLYLSSLKGLKHFSRESVLNCPFVLRMEEAAKETLGIVLETDKSLLTALKDELIIQFEELWNIMAFDYYGKAILEISPGLAEGLLDTELNIPVKEVRVPRNSFYVPMPEGINLYISTHVGPRRILGVYVTYQTGTTYKEDTALTFFAVAKDGVMGGYDDFSYYFWNLTFPFEGEELMEARLGRQLTKWEEELGGAAHKVQRESTEGIARLILNAFLYMSQPSSEQDTKFKPNQRMEFLRTNPRVEGAQKSAVLDNYWSSANFELFEDGHTIRLTKGKGGSRGSPGPHESPEAHTRRGHWHTVLYGTGRKEKKILWYRPIRVKGRMSTSGVTYKLD